MFGTDRLINTLPSTDRLTNTLPSTDRHLRGLVQLSYIMPTHRLAWTDQAASVNPAHIDSDQRFRVSEQVRLGEGCVWEGYGKGVVSADFCQKYKGRYDVAVVIHFHHGPACPPRAFRHRSLASWVESTRTIQPSSQTL